MATSCSAPPAPRLLKDFLQDQTTAATSRTTRFHKATEVFINAVKLLPFKSVKPPSILPRSISRRLSRSQKRETYQYEVKEVSITVKVKDILRWKSFRDLAEEQAVPVASPSRCTTTTATGTSTNSGRSSWCDSDVTAEDLPSWLGESDASAGENEIKLKSKKCLPVKTVGSYLIGTTTGTHLKGEMLLDEEELHTPLSVLDFPFREEEEEEEEEEESTPSSFHQTFSNIEIMKIKEFKGREKLGNRFLMDEEAHRIEEKANELVNCAKITCSIGGCDADVDHCLLLDFFRHELMTSRKLNGGDQAKKLRMAKAWLRGDDDGSLEWEMEGKREICVGEMEKGERWSKFEEEHEEMTVEMEMELLNSLLDELVIDLTSNYILS